MTKTEATKIKGIVRNTIGSIYFMHYSNGTLYIRVSSYITRHTDTEEERNEALNYHFEWLIESNHKREDFIKRLSEALPQYKVGKTERIVYGCVNDCSITIR